MRRGGWKIIYYHTDRRFELFDLAHDLGEEDGATGGLLPGAFQLVVEVGVLELVQIKTGSMPHDPN